MIIEVLRLLVISLFVTAIVAFAYGWISVNLFHFKGFLCAQDFGCLDLIVVMIISFFPIMFLVRKFLLNKIK